MVTRVLGVILATTLTLSSTASAEEPAPVGSAAATAATGDGSGEQQAEAPAQPGLPWQEGPAKLDLGHGASIDLPENFGYLAQPEAGKLMEKMGNLYNDDLIGLIAPKAEDAEYFVTLRYEESGYVKDDEELDAEEILEAMREGEEEYNAERKKLGFPPIHAAGWGEKPHYDRARHHLVWGLTVESPDGASVNYATRVLGRNGYVSLNLVTDPKDLAKDKPAAALLLSKTSFNPGKRYEDFDSSTDKVAEYGLTGLVLGGAGLGLAKAAKLGVLAKFSKVIIAALIAGKKFVVIALIAIGAFLKRLFDRRKNAADAA